MTTCTKSTLIGRETGRPRRVTRFPERDTLLEDILGHVPLLQSDDSERASSREAITVQAGQSQVVRNETPCNL